MSDVAITTPDGPVAPIDVERAVESLSGVDRAAAVGVGPSGTQLVAVVVAPTLRPRRAALAPAALAEGVREVSGVDVAAVLVAPALPRIGAAVDRARIGKWASHVLAGGRMRKP